MKAGRLVPGHDRENTCGTSLQEAWQTTAAVCATADAASTGGANWLTIDWQACTQEVRKLQIRIAKAVCEGRWRKVKALQWLLTHSFSAKALAVRRVTENQPMRAAERLQMTTRQIRRLVSRYRIEGAAGLVSRHRNRPSNRQLAPGLANLALTIIRERYADFGPTLACEKLRERHGVKIGTETVRRLMADAGLWVPRKLRPPKVYQPRNRRHFTCREPRKVSHVLTLQYDKVIYLLPDKPAMRKLIGKYVEVFEYPDGRIELRANGTALPYVTYDRLSEVDQRAIVENKRLGHALQVAQPMQQQRDSRRSRAAQARGWRLRPRLALSKSDPMVTLR